MTCPHVRVPHAFCFALIMGVSFVFPPILFTLEKYKFFVVCPLAYSFKCGPPTPLKKVQVASSLLRQPVFFSLRGHELYQLSMEIVFFFTRGLNLYGAAANN